ncbi:helix-turn-helix domain-containing protein [bacterium]|nr:helix-turn-helix domain-containing protein [bacterium]
MTNARKVRNTPTPAETRAGENHQSNPEQLLRSNDAAALLAISPRKLWELENAGQIPSVRFGRTVRFRMFDLVEWIASCRGKGCCR